MNRAMAFFIFFTIVLSIYTLVNYYIYIRGLQAIPASSALRPWFQWGFWVLAGFFVAGRFLERIYISYASDILIWAGSFWLAAMLYFFLIIVVFDLLRLVNHVVPFFPAMIINNPEKTRLMAMFASIILVAMVVIGGFINARNPVVRSLDIHIDKPAGSLNSLHAVVISDIHLGTMIGNGFFSRIVGKVNGLKPDIILLPGDMLDEDLKPVLRQNIGETLKQLHAPLGVYAIMGNHEHIGGASYAYNYLKENGLTIMRDTVMLIHDSFYLVGRDDRDKPRFAGEERTPLEILMEQVDPRYPVILLDHQPYYLEKAASLGVDLQLSGHTHHGQLWPLNHITKAIFTISRGYGKIDGMHAYVSNGVGTWGPPVRVGNRPEIVSLKIHFQETDVSF
jgi:uncharacterized protein